MAAGGGHELSEPASALWAQGLQAYDAFTGHFTTCKVVDANATLLLETAADNLEQLTFLPMDKTSGE